jgi:hypothetical protein
LRLGVGEDSFETIAVGGSLAWAGRKYVFYFFPFKSCFLGIRKVAEFVVCKSVLHSWVLGLLHFCVQRLPDFPESTAFRKGPRVRHFFILVRTACIWMQRC